jgi:tetratricopeptide (TPR) repeat protein
MRVERIAAALLAALWLAAPSLRAQPAESDAEALLRQAAQELSAGDAKTSLELCDEALSLAPTDARVLAQRAKAHLRLGQLDEAIADATQAQKLGPGKAAPYNIRSEAYFRKGRFQEALADAQRAVDLYPKGAVGYLNRAGAREALGGGAAEALADRKEAADLDPVDLAQYQAALKAHPQASPPPAAAQPPVAAQATVVAKPSVAAKPRVAAKPPVAARPPATAAAPAAARPASPPSAKKRLALAIGVAALAALLGWLAYAVLAARRPRPLIARYAEPDLSLLDPGEPSPGAVIAGKLILGGLVSRKACLCVYDGRDLGDRVLVVKRLCLGAEQEPRLRQALALAALKDPHLVPIDGVYEHNGQRYLAHEPVEGQDLRALLAQAPWHRLDLPQCLRILESVCAALGRAHEAGAFIGPLDFSTVFVRRDGSAQVEVVGAFVESEAGAEASSELRALADCLFELATGKPAEPGAASGLPGGLDVFFSRTYSSEAEFLAALRQLAAARAQG